LFYWSCEWTRHIGFCDDIATLIQISDSIATLFWRFLYLSKEVWINYI
jgi:hypothetical protein